MNRKRILALMAAICIVLSGCTQLPPEKAVDGLRWSESWITIGSVLGVDTPEGLTPRENNEALAANGMFYATWSMGDASAYVNTDGEDATIYDAQIYVLLASADSAEKAEDAMENWLAMAQGQYDISETTTEVCNGQTFTVITYDYISADNPYDGGASAFGRYQNFAISVELSYGSDFTGNALEILLDFLNHCHYST